MALSQEIKDRIFAAADALHAASETGEFPRVEAVRQESRAGMNNVVEGMKEWRQNQRKQVQAVRAPLPVELHGSVLGMGQSLWEAAQQLANESLDAAKVAFETEKSDLIQLLTEQSEAYEKQAARIAELERDATVATAAAQATAREMDDTRSALLAAEQATALANQRMTKAETERNKARTEAATVREEAAALRGQLEATKTQNADLLAALKSGSQNGK